MNYRTSQEQKLLESKQTATVGFVAKMITGIANDIIGGSNKRFDALTERLTKAEAKIKQLEELSILDFVGTAEPGVAYAKGTLALDSTGRMWFAVKDDDGTGDLCEPVWRLMSDRRLSVIGTAGR